MKLKLLIIALLLMCTNALAIENYDIDKQYETATQLYEQCQQALEIKPVLDIPNTAYTVEYNRIKLSELCRSFTSYELAHIGEICHMRITNVNFPDASMMRTDPKEFGRKLAEAVCDLEAILILKIASSISDQVTITI